MKILFNDNENFFDCKIKIISNHILEIYGIEKNLSGFKIYHDSGNLLGDYSDYTTLYRDLMDSYQLSNDNSTYKEPEEETTKQTLEDIKENKIQEMNNIQQNLIIQGIEVELSDGSKEKFTLSTNDQLSLNSLSVKNLEGLNTLPWHPADENVHCKFYSEEDMKRITDSCMNFVTYHITYFRDLRIYIRSLRTKEEVESITYGIKIPIKYQSEVLQTLLTNEMSL